MATAEAKTEELFTKHIQPADSFMTAVKKIIGAYSRLNDSGKVIELCNRVLSKYPDHERGLPIRTNLIKEYLGLNAKAQADGIAGQVLQKYSDRPDFAKIINGIADIYRGAEYYLKSIELYQAALKKAGDDQNDQLNAYAGMAKAKAYLQDNSAVDAIVQRLMVDYKDSSRLGFHVFQIAEEYYFRAEKALGKGNKEQAQSDFQKALTIWQKNIDQIDDPFHREMASYFKGIAYQTMQDYEKAVISYQQLVDNYPDYEKAWNAQFMIAVCHDNLYENNSINADEAKSKVVEACQKLELQYPCSKASGAAQMLLKKYESL